MLDTLIKTAWSGGMSREDNTLTIRLEAVTADGRWAQRVELDVRRLDRYPALYGQILDQMIRDIEGRL